MEFFSLPTWNAEEDAQGVDSSELYTYIPIYTHMHAYMHTQVLERTGQNHRSGLLSAYFDAIHCYFHAWLPALRWLHKITHPSRTYREWRGNGLIFSNAVVLHLLVKCTLRYTQKNTHTKNRSDIRNILSAFKRLIIIIRTFSNGNWSDFFNSSSLSLSLSPSSFIKLNNRLYSLIYYYSNKTQRKFFY